MKAKYNKSHTRSKWILLLIMIAILTLAASCGGGGSGGTGSTGSGSTGSGSTGSSSSGGGSGGATAAGFWEAHRYSNYNTVRGSITAGHPLTLDTLFGGWEEIVVGGYVTTNSTGQAQLHREGGDLSCPGFLYVFQSSSAGVNGTAISACPEGQACPENSTLYVSNCELLYTSSAGRVKITGTRAIISENAELQTVIVLVPEGTVEIEPVDETFPPYEISITEGQEPLGTYIVPPEMRQDAERVFGFEPGMAFQIERFVEPIQILGITPQIQRANLILLSSDLPLVPIPQMYNLQLSWLGENDLMENQQIAEAVLYSFEWGPDQEQVFSNIPFFFNLSSESLDVRAYGEYNPDATKELLAAAGYPEGFEIIFAFDESIPGVAELADKVGGQLMETGVFNVIDFIAFNPENASDVFAELEASGTPVLVLGGN